MQFCQKLALESIADFLYCIFFLGEQCEGIVMLICIVNTMIFLFLLLLFFVFSCR